MLGNRENLIEALISASDVVILALSESLIIKEWNIAAEKLFEFSKKEVLGKNFLDFFIPLEEREEFLTEFQKNLDGTESINYEYALATKSGKKKTLLWNAKQIPGESGQIQGILAFGKDITDRIEKEISLEASESKLRALINSAVDGIITIDHHGIIESVNPSTTHLFGYDKDEMIGNNIKMLMPEPDKSKHDGYIQNYLHTGIKKIIGIGREVKGKRKDGSIFPLRLSVSEITLDENRAFLGMIHDMTEQKEAESKIKEYAEKLEHKVEERTQEIRKTNQNLQKEIKDRKAIENALKEGQKLYSAIARNFPDGTISVLNQDLQYVFIEGKELFAMGVTSERLIGTKIADRLPEHLSNKITDVLQNVFNNQNETIEIELKNNYYVLNAVPLMNDEGEVKQILVVEENITKQKNAERDIRESLKKEIELNNLKSRFVSMASHEFRTPLSTILSSTSLLEHYSSPEDEEKRNKHLQRIKSSVGNLTSILNDFLSLSKLEEGVVKSNPISFNLRELCEELQEEMQTIAKKGQQIKYQHSGETIEIILDLQMLKNVLHNLLSNAIKYTAEDKSIEFFTAISGNTLIIEVKDEGIGIPEEDQHLLFERFFRAKNVINIQGTGLGLNIVKKYVELMNGSISFTSNEGKGSTFTIQFNNLKLA